MDVGFRDWANGFSEDKITITQRDRGGAQQQLRERERETSGGGERGYSPDFVLSWSNL